MIRWNSLSLLLLMELLGSSSGWGYLNIRKGGRTCVQLWETLRGVAPRLYWPHFLACLTQWASLQIILWCPVPFELQSVYRWCGCFIKKKNTFFHLIIYWMSGGNKVVIYNPQLVNTKIEIWFLYAEWTGVLHGCLASPRNS